jgi:hypothetical protein
MAQSELLLEALKRELRRQRITYQQVAKKLELSEASVKRMFSSGDMSLSRLESICELASWDLIDLSKAAQSSVQKIDCLTSEQEAEIASDLILLLVAVNVINGFTYDDLLSQYRLDEHTLIRKLAALDRLQLIDLLPGNRIKLRISQNFRWHPRGPIQSYFLDHVVQQFFDTRFDGKQEKLIVINGLLGEESHKEFHERMDKLAAEFSQSMKESADKTLEEKQGNTLVIALRRWRYKAFQDLAQADSTSHSSQ